MLCAGAGAVFVLEFGNENAKAARIPAVAQNAERGGTFRQLCIVRLLLAAAEHQRQQKRVNGRTPQLILHIVGFCATLPSRSSMRRWISKSSSDISDEEIGFKR